MILTFAELGINAKMFNGMTFSKAFAAIVNIMADRITMAQWQHPVTAVETLYDWQHAIIDVVNQTINVPPASVDNWIAINTQLISII